MQTKTNVFLDFDNTQFDGHLHNSLAQFIRQYEDNDINGLTRKQLERELMNIGPLSEGSKQAVKDALELSLTMDRGRAKGNPKHKAHSFEFFDGKGLNEFVGKSKGQGVDVVVLTASMYPNAIKAVYAMSGLTELKDISIISVPINSDRIKMAQDKNTEIQKYEENQRVRNQDLHTVHNIFVDDSKENIQVFRNSSNPATNTGILVPNGIVLKDLTTAVEKTLSGKQEYVSKGVSSSAPEVPPRTPVVPPKAKTDKASAHDYTENQDTEEGLYAYRDAAGELHSSKHKYKENVVLNDKNDIKGNLSKFTETQNKPQMTREQGGKSQASQAKGMDRSQVAPPLPPKAKTDQAPAVPPRGKVDQAPPVPPRAKADQAPPVPARAQRMR
jgi:hypothetical protein